MDDAVRAAFEEWLDDRENSKPAEVELAYVGYRAGYRAACEACAKACADEAAESRGLMGGSGNHSYASLVLAADLCAARCRALGK